jgi:hypothetical protein
MNNRPIYTSTGTLRVNDRELRIDTYYPLGMRRPEYKIFHVWEKDTIGKGESLTFASEDGFFNWLDAKQQPTQQVLF